MYYSYCQTYNEEACPESNNPVFMTVFAIFITHNESVVSVCGQRCEQFPRQTSYAWQ